MGYMDMITYKAWSWYDGRTKCEDPNCRAYARLEVRRFDTPNAPDVTYLCHNHIGLYFIPARAGKMDAQEDELLRIE